MRTNWISTWSLLALTATVVPACGDDTCNPGEVCPPPTGSFTLQTVSGNPLPAVLFQEGNDRVEITQGSLTLNADETFSLRVTFRITDGGDVETDEIVTIGTVSSNGNQLNFVSDDFDFTAVHSGNQLSFTLEFVIGGEDEDISFVFRR